MSNEVTAKYDLLWQQYKAKGFLPEVGKNLPSEKKVMKDIANIDPKLLDDSTGNLKTPGAWVDVWGSWNSAPQPEKEEENTERQNSAISLKR